MTCCTPWHYCGVGYQHWLVMLDAQTALDVARRALALGDGELEDLQARVLHTTRQYQQAEESFRRHTGQGETPPLTLRLSLGRLFGPATAFPAEADQVAQWIADLCVDAGESVPAVIQARIPRRVTTEPTYTETRTPEALWIHSPGYAQEEAA